ncbi:MAG: nicotinate (nicotinamide) nucleotide adenylyltransferase [Ruminococcus sp.]|nr:nicotinate (nicotinamide) nucleotide adenylyltransferase [Ruminococcus sp.]
MTTVLFGGSFDPVHMGHVNAVRSILREMPETDRVIIMPAFVNPFKAGEERKKGADGRQRLEMCRIAFKDIPRCEISDYELKKGDISYTAVTLGHLRELYPRSGFVLAVGSDCLESLPRWYRAEDIIKNAVIAAVSRRGEDTAEISRNGKIIEKMGGRVRIVPTEPFDISSTQIRKKIINNRDISCYMDKNVVEYIMRENIYAGT